MTRTIAPPRPTNVIWDITYACPLRCVHCYSESGRRPARQLSLADMLRVADAIIALRPDGVALAGGEPLAVKGIFEVAGRFARAGVPVVLYTGGWSLPSEMIEASRGVIAEVHVSLDGATREVNDAIRGRAGAFDRAVGALARLDEAVRRQPDGATGPLPRFGIDCVLVRSNLHQLDDLCTQFAPRYPALSFLSFGAVVPSGLASRPDYSDELLTDEQADRLASPAEAQRLSALAPPTVTVLVSDNRVLRMDPERVARGEAFPTMQVESDGRVRAMAIYEGTVGSLLEEPGEVLWERAVRRWTDPFVVAALSGATSMTGWAAATRRIDEHFGSTEVLARIAGRRPYLPSDGVRVTR